MDTLGVTTLSAGAADDVAAPESGPGATKPTA